MYLHYFESLIVNLLWIQANNQEPALELHSRAVPSVEAYNLVNGPDTGRNSGGRQKKPNLNLISFCMILNKIDQCAPPPRPPLRAHLGGCTNIANQYWLSLNYINIKLPFKVTTFSHWKRLNLYLDQKIVTPIIFAQNEINTWEGGGGSYFSFMVAKDRAMNWPRNKVFTLSFPGSLACYFMRVMLFSLSSFLCTFTGQILLLDLI